MVGDREATVLLAKLYAEQMVAAKEAPYYLPDNVPDLMLEYLNRINHKVREFDDRTVHRAAKVIAWECLRGTFRPQPADYHAVAEALCESPDHLLDYMEHNLKLVETLGPARDRLRFVLDPLAEYLASMHLMDSYGSDERRWLKLVDRINAAPGAPHAVEGFLVALGDCCRVKGSERRIPSSVLCELEKHLHPKPALAVDVDS
ncbi:MAG: hypothetical protein JO061_04420 [Acidobacteriaceae bacterium]|nr:hypothetical protein [Acidobacteriaceae bacterium]